MSEDTEVGAPGERRRHPRMPVRLEVVFRSGEELISCYMFNVGQWGLFIHTETPLAMDDDVMISFKLPGIARVFEARGRVVWSVAAGGGSVSGMGIAFYQIAPDDRRAIEKFIGEELAK